MRGSRDSSRDAQTWGFQEGFLSRRSSKESLEPLLWAEVQGRSIPTRKRQVWVGQISLSDRPISDLFETLCSRLGPVMSCNIPEALVKNHGSSIYPPLPLVSNPPFFWDDVAQRAAAAMLHGESQAVVGKPSLVETKSDVSNVYGLDHHVSMSCWCLLCLFSLKPISLLEARSVFF